jgi:hypothetical protein
MYSYAQSSKTPDYCDSAPTSLGHIDLSVALKHASSPWIIWGSYTERVMDTLIDIILNLLEKLMSFQLKTFSNQN